MKNWISKETYNNLLNELKNIDKVKRPELQKKLEKSRKEGDLSENTGYHVAKDDLAKLEHRVKQIKNIIKNSIIGEVNDNKIVNNGKKVSLLINNIKKTFIVGSRENQKNTELTVISLESPIGKVIFNKKENDIIDFELPNKKKTEIIIKKIENF
jgi:transcription elongation factor GreA